MAQRRMFSLKIIDSAKFLKMPISSQLLYFHLGLRADDDGVVEAYNVLRLLGSAEDDLKILFSKGFIQVLNEDMVTFICDWTEHNKIRSDRKTDSIYKDLLLKMLPETKLLESKQRADLKKKEQESCPLDVQWSDEGQTNVSIGKVRLGEDRIENIYVSVIEYLNEKTGKKFKSSTQANKKVIDARVNEGYGLEDFKKVIDNKVIDWKDKVITNKDKSFIGNNFLRPQTLFSNKFESYLNEDYKIQDKKNKLPKRKRMNDPGYDT